MFLIAKALDCNLTPPYRINYQVYLTPDDRVIDKGKEVGIKAGAAIVHPDHLGVVPTESSTNSKATVKLRVEDQTNVVDPKRQFYNYRREFAELLIPGSIAGTGVPVLRETVEEHQTKPMQVARNKQESKHLRRNKNRVKAHQKKQVGTKIEPGRNISGVETDHTINLSMYNYGFKKQVMVGQKFYAPGRLPCDVATMIHEYCHDSDAVIETDYSKFDGTISAFLRSVEFVCYMRWINKPHSKEMERLLRNEVNLQSTTRDGVSYNSKYSRLSGSPLTTEGNTLVNAFVAYCAYRSTMKPKEAFDAIGPKFGDDGIDKAGHPFESVAGELGLKLKLTEVRTHLTFCGRVFVNPKYTTTSICDPVRALVKIPKHRARRAARF